MEVTMLKGMSRSTFILFQDKVIAQKTEKLVKQHHLVNLSLKERQSAVCKVFFLFLIYSLHMNGKQKPPHLSQSNRTVENRVVLKC